jgi:hypothetical protein
MQQYPDFAIPEREGGELFMSGSQVFLTIALFHNEYNFKSEVA